MIIKRAACSLTQSFFRVLFFVTFLCYIYLHIGSAFAQSSNFNQTVHPAFQSILPTLRNQTQIPIVLPTYLPDDDFLTEGVNKPSAYARISKIISSSYTIQLEATEDCYGTGACHLGSVSGKSIASKILPINGTVVALSKNMKGYYISATCGASCGDSTLSWDQNKIRYEISSKAGSLSELTKSANSAINSQMPVS